MCLNDLVFPITIMGTSPDNYSAKAVRMATQFLVNGASLNPIFLAPDLLSLRQVVAAAV